MRALSACGSCGSDRASDGGPLLLCIHCRSLAYCSPEHQAFDWKRHKPVCKTLQLRRSKDDLSAILLQNVLQQPSTSAFNDNGIRPPPVTLDQMNAGSYTLLSEAVRLPVDVNDLRTPMSLVNKKVYEGCQSSNMEKSFFDVAEMSANQIPTQEPVPVTATPPRPTSTSSSTERLVQTDDPDIQIIEDPRRPMTSRPRKRPTSNFAGPSVPLKDHSKNLLYSTTLQEHQKHLTNKGLVLNTHQAMVMRLRYIAEHVIRSLNEFGWAVVDNFLGASQCEYTYKELERLYERGLFEAGQVMDGRDKDEYHIKDIRSDYIYWFDGTDRRADDAATIRLLVSMIDSVILHFNKRIPPYTIGGRSRAMCAIYPGNGTRYVKHVDNPVRDGRCMTTIYYCNADWDSEKDGGALRLYPESSAIPMDIEPRADRLVFFWSDRRNPHEVMPVYRNRFAITIWYMDREERQEALDKIQRQEEQKRREVGAISVPIIVPKIESMDIPQTAYIPPELLNLPRPLPIFPSIAPTAAKVSSEMVDITDSGVEDADSTGSTHHARKRAASIAGSGRSAAAFSVERHSEQTDSGSVGSDQDEEQSLPRAPDVNPEYVI